MLTAALVVLSAFPASESPVAIGPPTLAPSSSTASCTVRLFHSAALSNYGQVEVSQFAPPADCPPPWSDVTLDWHGSVRGVQ